MNYIRRAFGVVPYVKRVVQENLLFIENYAKRGGSYGPLCVSNLWLCL